MSGVELGPMEGTNKADRVKSEPKEKAIDREKQATLQHTPEGNQSNTDVLSPPTWDTRLRNTFKVAKLVCKAGAYGLAALTFFCIPTAIGVGITMAGNKKLDKVYKEAKEDVEGNKGISISQKTRASDAKDTIFLGESIAFAFTGALRCCKEISDLTRPYVHDQYEVIFEKARDTPIPADNTKSLAKKTTEIVDKIIEPLQDVIKDTKHTSVGDLFALLDFVKKDDRYSTDDVVKEFRKKAEDLIGQEIIKREKIKSGKGTDQAVEMT